MGVFGDLKESQRLARRSIQSSVRRVVSSVGGSKTSEQRDHFMSSPCRRICRLAAFGVTLITIAMATSWFIWSSTTTSDTSGTSTRIRQTFPASGVKKIILRAANADTTEVTIDPIRDEIDISGIPTCGAKGYHSPDPNWRETPASEWGLNFVAARHGNILVISSKSEILYIHHHYVLQSVKLRIPTEVDVVRVPRELTGDGEPDLKEPKP